MASRDLRRICSLHFRQWITLPILVSLYEGEKKDIKPLLQNIKYIDTMAVPERQRLGKRTSSRKVFSDVHKSGPCTSCTLCKERSVQYTHSVKWKDGNLLKFLQSIEPDLNILPDACICRNCRDSLSVWIGIIIILDGPE